MMLFNNPKARQPLEHTLQRWPCVTFKVLDRKAFIMELEQQMQKLKGVHDFAHGDATHLLESLKQYDFLKPS